MQEESQRTAFQSDGSSMHLCIPVGTITNREHSVESSKFNYRPAILRTWALVALLLLTATLIGLLEFAVKALPHGNVRLPVDTDDIHDMRHRIQSVLPRQAVLNGTTYTVCHGLTHWQR